MLKSLLFAIISLLLAGCDFTAPLSGKPEMAIDGRALGLWERVKPDGETEQLLVMALNEEEYIISWPKGAATELFARAHLFEFSGKTLVQLQWFGNSDGDVPDDDAPDDDRVFQIASYTVTGDALEIRLLNADVTGKDFQSTDELARAIKNNHDNPNIFRSKMIFKRNQ
jgi:hypothetical protein